MFVPSDAPSLAASMSAIRTRLRYRFRVSHGKRHRRRWPSGVRLDSSIRLCGVARVHGLVSRASPAGHPVNALKNGNLRHSVRVSMTFAMMRYDEIGGYWRWRGLRGAHAGLPDWPSLIDGG
ncbi:hypothetical protein THER5_1957 [Bifidobacterium thermacidophilum subsp. thermacidophilum]|uniref:Uncharacterized protein n=1 Tax=Bifidobacterium thermacidophilum subsp. thermacidophilum TaxID=79262 RepID=A0A087E5Z9_9BIFI|nr:hypothetical protein THER5_1957 [Bifidobacterium thermacidophilum subsp. thermacidophilum]